MSYQNPLKEITPAVKIIIIINVAIFLITNLLKGKLGVDFVHILGLHLPESTYFAPYQYITHMFTQTGLTHLFFNMFAVFMFGRILESVWGSKRFLVYYFITGLGAAALHTLVSWYGYRNMQEEFYAFQNTPEPALLAEFLRQHLGGIPAQINEFIASWELNPHLLQATQTAEQIFQDVINGYINVPTIGASGAVFGILLAFGMLFPNTELFLMFIPIPIKAKYFVILYGLAELYMGIQNQVGDNVAHFAHLGGMLFGFLLITYWRKHSKHFY